MRRIISSITLVASLCLVATPVVAQDSDPEVRVVTTSTFNVPYGDDYGTVLSYVSEWMVGSARANPNILSYRVLTHLSGSRGSQIVLLAEWKDGSAVLGPCPECAAWFEANQSAEGTDARAEEDKGAALFTKYYSGHSDQIYSANMARAKDDN